MLLVERAESVERWIWPITPLIRSGASGAIPVGIAGTRRFGGGWLAPLACRILNDAPQLDSDAVGRSRTFYSNLSGGEWSAKSTVVKPPGFLRHLPTRSYAKAFGASVGIHAVLVAIVMVGVAGHSLNRSRTSQPQAGIVGSEHRRGTSGVMSVAAPPVGPSLSPELGAKYVGRYEWRSSNQGTRILEVHLINDGETEHWSLALVENQGPLRTLNAVTRDSFVFQLARDHSVLFRRVGDSVTSISIRRGRDTSWAERVTGR